MSFSEKKKKIADFLLVCNKSGENLVIYSRRSYERGSGHSPNPPTQSRPCGYSANGEAEEGEEKQRHEKTRLRHVFTACASDLLFHNPFGCRAIHMLTTESRLTLQLSSVALNYPSKSNVSTHNMWLGVWSICCGRTCASMPGWCKCLTGC